MQTLVTLTAQMNSAIEHYFDIEEIRAVVDRIQQQVSRSEYHHVKNVS